QWQDEKCRGLVSDPTTYLMRHIDTLLPPTGPVRIATFRRVLGAACPVLDGGVVHEAVGDELTQNGVHFSNHRERLSPALSLALRNLKEQGIARYWCPDDQRDFLLMSFDEKVAFLERDERSVDAADTR